MSVVQKALYGEVYQDEFEPSFVMRVQIKTPENKFENYDFTNKSFRTDSSRIHNIIKYTFAEKDGRTKKYRTVLYVGKCQVFWTTDFFFVTKLLRPFRFIQNFSGENVNCFLSTRKRCPLLCVTGTG